MGSVNVNSNQSATAQQSQNTQFGAQQSSVNEYVSGNGGSNAYDARRTSVPLGTRRAPSHTRPTVQTNPPGTQGTNPANGSEAAKVLEGKHLNSKKLKQLYFLNEDFDEDVKKIKQFEKLVIYSGSNATSIATSFAHNFGEESTNFRGKRISGDDLFLNTALAKDPLGVSFNALPNIFDLKSRHIKENLTIIGIDVKKSLEDSFSDKASLDELILALENGKVSEVAVEKIGVSYNIADDAVNQFLSWVLAQGTKYNHEFGLLNLDNKLAQAQINKVKTEFTAQK